MQQLLFLSLTNTTLKETCVITLSSPSKKYQLNVTTDLYRNIFSMLTCNESEKNSHYISKIISTIDVVLLRKSLRFNSLLEKISIILHNKSRKYEMHNKFQEKVFFTFHLNKTH